MDGEIVTIYASGAIKMVPEPRYCIVLCVVIVLPCVERAKSGAMFHLTRPECILVKSPPSQCSHQPTNQPTNQQNSRFLSSVQ